MFGRSWGPLVAGVVGLVMSLLQLRTGRMAPLTLSVFQEAVFAGG